MSSSSTNFDIEKRLSAFNKKMETLDEVAKAGITKAEATLEHLRNLRKKHQEKEEKINPLGTEAAKPHQDPAEKSKITNEKLSQLRDMLAKKKEQAREKKKSNIKAMHDSSSPVFVNCSGQSNNSTPAPSASIVTTGPISGYRPCGTK